MTSAQNVLVEGRGTLLIGLRAELAPGDRVVFGRSRRCALSLRKAPAFLASKDQVALIRSDEFNRVSREHLEIVHESGGRIVVRDLSRNGTWVRGVRIDDQIVVQTGARPVEVAPVGGGLGALSVTFAAP